MNTHYVICLMAAIIHAGRHTSAGGNLGARDDGEHVQRAIDDAMLIFERVTKIPVIPIKP